MRNWGSQQSDMQCSYIIKQTSFDTSCAGRLRRGATSLFAIFSCIHNAKSWEKQNNANEFNRPVNSFRQDTKKNRLIPIATCNITNLRFRSVLPEISFSLLEKRRVDKEKGQQKTIATAYQITSEHSHAVMAYVEISRSGGVFRRYSNILTYFLPITNNVAIFIVVPCLRRNHLVSAAWCVRR